METAYQLCGEARIALLHPPFRSIKTEATTDLANHLYRKFPSRSSSSSKPKSPGVLQSLWGWGESHRKSPSKAAGGFGPPYGASSNSYQGLRPISEDQMLTSIRNSLKVLLHTEPPVTEVHPQVQKQPQTKLDGTQHAPSILLWFSGLV